MAINGDVPYRIHWSLTGSSFGFELTFCGRITRIASSSDTSITNDLERRISVLIHVFNNKDVLAILMQKESINVQIPMDESG